MSLFNIKLTNEELFLEFYSATNFRIFSNKNKKSYIFLKEKETFNKVLQQNHPNYIEFKTSCISLKFFDNYYEIYFKDVLFASTKLELNFKEEQEDLSLKEKEGHKTSSNNEYKFLFKSKLLDDDNFYGLGDKTGFINKKYYEFINYNTDNPSIQLENMRSLYKSINIFYDIKKYGCFAVILDNTYKSIYNFGTNLKDYYFGAINGDIDVHYYFDESIKTLCSRTSEDLGRHELPPLKALGNQQSRWSYKDKNEVQSVIDGYKKYNIPLDIVHLDIDYMQNYKDFSIDKNKFPKFSSWLKEIDEKYGVGIVAIIDAGVKQETGYNVYDEGIENNYFATLNDELYVNEVWPGDSVFPNFVSEKVQKWWGKHCSSLIKEGIVGIWNDMNEPASFKGPLPDNVEFIDDSGNIHYHDEIHNVYGHLMNKATKIGFDLLNKRPFVITRAAFLGSNRYTSVWTGDNHSIYAHLQLSLVQLMNLSLSGFSFCGCDVGGFSFNSTKELLIRWIEAGFMSPFLRNHSALGTSNQEPYAFDEETAKIYKKFVDLRYKLLPYLYDLFYKHYFNGELIIRPLLYNFQDDNLVYDISDEYMVGDSIIFAPILEQGKDRRIVYLPKGKWIDFDTKEIIEGGVYKIFTSKLDESKIFVKYNSIIPMFENHSHVKNDYRKITFVLFGDSGEYTHFKDDYSSLNYKKGIFSKYDVKIFEKIFKVESNIQDDIKYDNIEVLDYLTGKLI